MEAGGGGVVLVHGEARKRNDSLENNREMNDCFSCFQIAAVCTCTSAQGFGHKRAHLTLSEGVEGPQVGGDK